MRLVFGTYPAVLYAHEESLDVGTEISSLNTLDFRDRDERKPKWKK